MPMIAAVLSAVCAIVVAAFFFTGRKEDARPLATGTASVLEVAKPVATPASTPATAHTPALVVVHDETPAPTQGAPVAVSDNTTTRTAAVATAALVVSGQVRDDGGMVTQGVEVYAVPYVPGGAQASVREAFRKGELAGRTASDAGGNFEQRLNAADAYYVGVMLDGEPQPFTQIVNEHGGSTKERVLLTLPKPFEVRGTIVNENGLPLPQIPLKVSWRVNTLREADAKLQTRDLTTDDSGRFASTLFEPVSLRVEINDEKLAAPYLASGSAVEMTRTDLAGTREYRVDLQVITGQRIAGRVMKAKPDGGAADPIEGVPVTAERLAGDKNFPSQGPLTAKSDASGDFRFERLYPGIYRLGATDSEYAPAPTQDVVAGGADRAQFLLQPFSPVRGVLVIGGGAKAGEKITVSLMDRYEGWRQEAIVRDDGTAPFAFPAVKPGTYLLAAETGEGDLRQYAEKKVEHAAASFGDTGELRLEPLGQVRARLLPSQDITDFNEVAVTAKPVSPTGDPFGGAAAHNDWRRTPATSIAEGGVTTVDNMSAGVEYLLLVENRATKQVIGSASASLTSTQPIKIALQGTGNITGFVKNSRNEACTETKVELRTGLGSVEGEAPDMQTRTTMTDYKGAYTFPNVPSGQCRIALAGDDSTSRLVTVTAGKDFNYDFTCRTYVSITFHVKDADDKPFKDKEAFYVVPTAGTVTDYPVRELRFGAMDARLEPGNYIITRMSTLASKSFEVSPRLDGEMTIDFTTATP
ncbi:carboxypeptidase regulatory-like domain-containing protein [Candidatus Sumerlaeota bacterium]|nr:carboxypeptidase regulatory-like domain-containing protein [Candidatus Sumerlaeota bacterium]